MIVWLFRALWRGSVWLYRERTSERVRPHIQCLGFAAYTRVHLSSFYACASPHCPIHTDPIANEINCHQKVALLTIYMGLIPACCAIFP
jgi:hypothetical protein